MFDSRTIHFEFFKVSELSVMLLHCSLMIFENKNEKSVIFSGIFLSLC